MCELARPFLEFFCGIGEPAVDEEMSLNLLVHLHDPFRRWRRGHAC
jgi:hypothetical protein